MSHDETGKQTLPPPYQLDLFPFLRGLDRRWTATRRKLANRPATAGFLAAALRLVKQNCGPGASRTPAGPNDDNSVERPLLHLLSQRAVVAEFRKNPDPFPRKTKLSTLRCTWKSHSHFIADLLRFGLSAIHYPVSRRLEVDTMADDAILGEDLVTATHRLCFFDLTGILNIPMFRLQLIAAASSEGDEVIQQALSERYAETTEQWKIIYRRFLQDRGLRLRPDVGLDQVADLLSAVAEGLALRQIGDPNARVVDHVRQRSLLGTAALALIIACLEPADTGNGVSLEQAVRDKARRPSRTGAD